jgi:methylated-DNA-[protein]-cysteine S-methyltransferase
MDSCIYLPSPVGVLKIIEVNEEITAILFTDLSEGSLPVKSESITPVQQQCIAELNAYFQSNLRQFTFPMAQTGTPFQQRVWQQLQQIPFGKTISYLQLAVQLGDAKCIRAAGTANGKNQLSIVVPCHRVIGSNQSLTGYAGGLWRKQWLLEHEAKWAHGVQQLFQ